MLAKNSTDEKWKRAVFLTLVGEKTYNLLTDLASPAKPAELKLSEIIDLLNAHFNPKPLVIVERCKFYHRHQENTENVPDYLATLRKCADYCNFGDSLQQALRDRFVCGLNSSAIQKRLLAESEFTFKGALEMAQTMEVTAKQAEYLNISK